MYCNCGITLLERTYLCRDILYIYNSKVLYHIQSILVAIYVSLIAKFTGTCISEFHCNSHLYIYIYICIYIYTLHFGWYYDAPSKLDRINQSPVPQHNRIILLE